jgi:hypothetical protein
VITSRDISCSSELALAEGAAFASTATRWACSILRELFAKGGGRSERTLSPLFHIASRPTRGAFSPDELKGAVAIITNAAAQTVDIALISGITLVRR